MSNIIPEPTGTDANPDRLTFLPIDPFAARRDLASRIAGLGGPHPSGSGYAFQSLDIYPVLGPVRFTLTFHGLAATTGTLTVRIHAVSLHPNTAPMLVHSVSTPLRDIAANDGILDVGVTSRRNMFYTVGGSIDDDTDASALGLSLSLDPREREAAPACAAPAKPAVSVPRVTPIERLVVRPELATLRPPVLARPVSQAMTAAQARDPLVGAWNAALHQADGSDAERWENAFILQALHYHGIATDGGAGLGIARHGGRLPAYLAGRGCTVLVAGTHRDDLPDGDPGLALERLVHPDLCPPRRFFEAVNLTLFEDLAIPAGLGGFDFLWSSDAAGGRDARERFTPFVRTSMGCLKPGGVAIHLLRYSGEIGAPTDPRSTSYGRAEIERMALSLVADAHEVAQLKFGIDAPDRPGDQSLPFALVARRIR